MAESSRHRGQSHWGLQKTLRLARQARWSIVMLTRTTNPAYAAAPAPPPYAGRARAAVAMARPLENLGHRNSATVGVIAPWRSRSTTLPHPYAFGKARRRGTPPAGAHHWEREGNFFPGTPTRTPGARCTALSCARMDVVHHGPAPRSIDPHRVVYHGPAPRGPTR